VAVAVAIVVLTSVGGSFIVGVISLKEVAREQALVLADGAISANVFFIPQAACDLLKSLIQWPDVGSAEVFGPDGQLLGALNRDQVDPRCALPGVGARRATPARGLLTVRQEMRSHDDHLGLITITLNVGNLVRRTAWTGVITFVGACAAFWVSGWLLRRHEPAVLQPLHALDSLMAQVHVQADFSARARPSDIVELDALGRGFNEMIEKVQDRDRRLADLAFSDKLTGLANRPAFLDRLDREVQRAAYSGRRLGLLFIDLDGFKQINDTLGHEAGDRLLVEAAQRLREVLRPSDAAALASAAANDGGLARLGGDEFTVLVANLHAVDEVLAIARRIGDALRRPFTLGERQVSISGSIGCAVFPEHGRDARTLLRNADAAMYESKRAGRDNCRIFGAAGVAPAQAPTGPPRLAGTR
jgi:diguanylate cyclase (GGDEF)-like protein